MDRFCFVTPVIGLSRPKTGEDDNDNDCDGMEPVTRKETSTSNNFWHHKNMIWC
jgi:hypothetical protein